MTKLQEIYKCDICGNIVEVLHTGVGELVCCGQPMTLQSEQSDDLIAEKHVPEILENENSVRIQIGKVLHPMQENHYIEWIEVELKNGNLCKKFFKWDDIPELSLQISIDDIKKIRAYCNVHGLWSN